MTIVCNIGLRSLLHLVHITRYGLFRKYSLMVRICIRARFICDGFALDVF